MSESINRKVKLLFVITSLRQGGAERYLFEICKALNKDIFDVEVLMRNKIYSDDYYFRCLEESGIMVHTKLRKMSNPAFVFPFLNRIKYFRRIFNFLNTYYMKPHLLDFFTSYDLICVIQIENYYLIQDLFTDNRRIVIHLMSNAFQYNYDIYSDCRENREYRFILMDPSQKTDLVSANLKKIDLFHFPLVLDFRKRQLINVQRKRSQMVKIGIFMRISHERPAEPLFYCFRELINFLDATLHFYGSGDPDQFGPKLEELGIRDSVVFEGHRVDIERTLNSDDLSLAWMTCNDLVLGYASMELASYGFPTVFWNLGSEPNEKIYTETGGAVHAFSSIISFVAFNHKIITNSEKLKEVGLNLRKYVVSKFDVDLHIQSLEKYYFDVVNIT